MHTVMDDRSHLIKENKMLTVVGCFVGKLFMSEAGEPGILAAFEQPQFGILLPITSLGLIRLLGAYRRREQICSAGMGISTPRIFQKAIMEPRPAAEPVSKKRRISRHKGQSTGQGLGSPSFIRSSCSDNEKNIN